MNIFNSRTIWTAYSNTIFRTVAGTGLAVFFTFCGAYPLSKKSFPLRKTFTIILMVTMFFNGGLIPGYLLIRNLGMLDTYWALIIPGMLSAFNIYLVRNFIQTIPASLEESAEIDGASHFQILMKIIIPLSTPILATIALWAAVGYWNEWFAAMIYTRDTKFEVLQLLLRRVMNRATVQGIFRSITPGMRRPDTMSVRAATLMVTIGPILFVYPFLQRYFVKGIMIGSLKG